MEMTNRANNWTTVDEVINGIVKLNGYKIEFKPTKYDSDFKPSEWYLVATNGDSKYVSTEFDNDTKESIKRLAESNNEVTD